MLIPKLRIMGSRNKHAEIMGCLESMSSKIECVAKISRDNNEELRRIRPQKTFDPIPRPKQGTQIARGSSVTKYILQLISEKNAEKEDNRVRYLKNSDDVDDKQYNADAMNCLEWILGFHLGSDLGRKTWEQVCKSDPRKMGLIGGDAMNAPELAAFPQAGQWAIPMLISNKINSKIRYNRCKEEQKEKKVSLAPMMVPDLATNTIAPLHSNVENVSNFVGVNGQNPPHNEIQQVFDEIEENHIHGYVGNCNGGSHPVQGVARTANNLRVEVVRPVRRNASDVSHPQPAASAINQDFSASIRGPVTRSRGMRRGITREGRVRGATGRVTKSTGIGAIRRAS